MNKVRELLNTKNADEQNSRFGMFPRESKTPGANQKDVQTAVYIPKKHQEVSSHDFKPSIQMPTRANRSCQRPVKNGINTKQMVSSATLAVGPAGSLPSIPLDREPSPLQDVS